MLRNEIRKSSFSQLIIYELIFTPRDSQIMSKLNKKSGQDSINSSFSERNYENSCLPKIIYCLHVDHISPMSW